MDLSSVVPTGISLKRLRSSEITYTRVEILGEFRDELRKLLSEILWETTEDILLRTSREIPKKSLENFYRSLPKIPGESVGISTPENLLKANPSGTLGEMCKDLRTIPIKLLEEILRKPFRQKF